MGQRQRQLHRKRTKAAEQSSEVSLVPSSALDCLGASSTCTRRNQHRSEPVNQVQFCASKRAMVLHTPCASLSLVITFLASPVLCPLSEAFEGRCCLCADDGPSGSCGGPLGDHILHPGKPSTVPALRNIRRAALPVRR